MAIPFHCPHCGAFTDVDEIYAGHTGPCAICARPITIPHAPAMQSAGGAGTATAAPAQTKSGMFLLLVVIASGALAAVLLVVLGLALLRPAVQVARSAAAQSECESNLLSIGIALQAYHAAHETYPPAYIADADGKPMHSWRVLILPYLGDQAATVYNQVNFDKPWDDPENIRLAAFMPQEYGCPDHPEALDQQETTYMVLVGPNTLFPGAKAVSGREILDPLTETIMVVETAQAGVNWMKPQDLDMTRTSFEINGREETDPGSHHHGGGAHVLTADGEVHLLQDEFSPDHLNGMATINGREALPQNLLQGF